APGCPAWWSESPTIAGFPRPALEQTSEEATTPNIYLRNILSGGRFTLASKLMRNCCRLRSRNLATNAGSTVRIFLTVIGSLALSMSFFREKTSVRKASASSLSITPHAFTVLRFRTHSVRFGCRDFAPNRNHPEPGRLDVTYTAYADFGKQALLGLL